MNTEPKSAPGSAAASAADVPLLRLRGIDKQFATVKVLKGINFNVRRGEVHALVGENGAGKSTLMHIIAGVHQPDGGQIDFDGTPDRHIATAHHAQAMGIATVFQERSLFVHLSVAENIFAGRHPVNAWGKIDHSQLRRDTQRLLGEVGLAVDPDTLVETLSPDQQQMVEIAKALSLDARLIIFDEPTAALTSTETRVLFNVIALLRRRGVGLIYISHRLEEIFGLADRVTVLKDGTHQGTLPVAGTTPDDLVRRMVGRSVLIQRHATRPGQRTTVPALEVRHLYDPPSRQGQRTCLRDVSFTVNAGEIVGLAGLAGAGRTETALAIIGARERGTGEILVAGQPVEISTPADAIAAGIGYLPEDRKSAGLFPEMNLAENMVAAGLAKFGTWWLHEKAQRSFAARNCDRLKIACRGIDQPVVQLSGGNQQKCLFARWLLVNPRILIVDEPTRGVDVGAKSEVHALLRELSQQGAAVLMISSDLPEILAVSDRILVMRGGRIAGELDGATASEMSVMRLASLD